MNYQKAKFITSAAKINQLPDDSIIEVAFAGRSNSGKSSALNVLTNQKNLARTSKTPGRTQLLNYFNIDSNKYLVDLPGYGYAKVPEAIKRNWEETLDKYLTTRDALKGIVLLVDSRHLLKEFDKMMIKAANILYIHLNVVLTKSDKLTNSKKADAKRNVSKYLETYNSDLLSVQTFSALKKDGLTEMEEFLNKLFES